MEEVKTELDLQDIIAQAESEAGVEQSTEEGSPVKRRRRRRKKTIPPVDNEVLDLMKNLPPEDFNHIIIEGLAGAIRGASKILEKLIAAGMECEEEESMLYARYVKVYLQSLPNLAERLNNPGIMLWLVVGNYLSRRLDIILGLVSNVGREKKRDSDSEN